MKGLKNVSSMNVLRCQRMSIMSECEYNARFTYKVVFVELCNGYNADF